MDDFGGEGMHDIARAKLAQQAVAFAFGERYEEIASPNRRTRNAAHARQTAMYLAHVAFGMSLGRVAQAFGRDRSTVAYACRVIEDRREDGDFDRPARGVPPRCAAPSEPAAAHRGRPAAEGRVTAARSGELRAIKRLSAAGMIALPIPGEEDVYGVYPNGDRRRRAVARLSAAAVARFVSAGALSRAPSGEGVELTREGRALARRDAARESQVAFRAQHLELATAPAEGEAPAGRVVNLTESPLAWLARRADQSGEPFITSRHLAAGERLRADFHRGRYLGRLTSDWTAPPRGSAARGPGRAQLDPVESVVAARDRVAAALRHVGSGLDRVLTAVCLEGRGLDEVERGFGWPRRSGKIVLRIALGRLADHYGLPGEG